MLIISEMYDNIWTNKTGPYGLIGEMNNMILSENEKVSRIIRWIRRNKVIWGAICGNNWLDFTIGDFIDMLENVTREEMYEFALILIAKLDQCEHMDEAITNVIINRINEPNLNTGILMECIQEFKLIATQEGIMEKEVQI